MLEPLANNTPVLFHWYNCDIQLAYDFPNV